MARATAPGIEWLVLMNSTLKQPSSTVSPGFTVFKVPVTCISWSLCSIRATVRSVPYTGASNFCKA